MVRIFLIGCAALLLVVGCAGTTSSESSNNKGQGSSPQATDSEVEARCEGTRTYHIYQVLHKPGWWNGPLRYGSEEDMKKADKKAGQEPMDFGLYTTNDLPGCPKGGLLLGTEGSDRTISRKPARPSLDGGDGDDTIRALGGSDYIFHQSGDDVVYGGDGDDELVPDSGKDVIYGGDGNDKLYSNDDGGDKLYCGAGRDKYIANKNDYVDSSCEVPVHPPQQCCAA